jgi:hypothetical protein
MQELAEKLDAEPEGIEFLDTRVRFYREVYDSASNPLLVELIEELRGHVGRFLLGFRFDGQGHTHRTHTALVDFVRSGDIDAAEAWLREHLEEVRAGIVDLASTADEETEQGAGAAALSAGKAEPAEPDVTRVPSVADRLATVGKGRVERAGGVRRR